MDGARDDKNGIYCTGQPSKTRLGARASVSRPQKIKYQQGREDAKIPQLELEGY